MRVTIFLTSIGATSILLRSRIISLLLSKGAIGLFQDKRTINLLYYTRLYRERERILKDEEFHF